MCIPRKIKNNIHKLILFLMLQFILSANACAFLWKNKEIPKGNHGLDSSGKYEYMAVAPSGKTSPIFNSHDKCVEYTNKFSENFGNGTVIHRRKK